MVVVEFLPQVFEKIAKAKNNPIVRIPVKRIQDWCCSFPDLGADQRRCCCEETQRIAAVKRRVLTLTFSRIIHQGWGIATVSEKVAYQSRLGRVRRWRVTFGIEHPEARKI
jgi:hypothetical protein